MLGPRNYVTTAIHFGLVVTLAGTVQFVVIEDDT